jgi:hypothetical protein
MEAAAKLHTVLFYASEAVTPELADLALHEIALRAGLQPPDVSARFTLIFGYTPLQLGMQLRELSEAATRHD